MCLSVLVRNPGFAIEQGWLGFDCAHSGDAPDQNLLSDILSRSYNSFSGIARSTEYVRKNVFRLILQAQVASILVAKIL